MEFSASLENFQESVLACRPRDMMGFAVRYFKDERQPNPEEAHAVHMLPFLLFKNQKFKNAACTVYCHQLTVENAFSRSLEPSVVCNVLSRIDLQALGLKSKSIDEVSLPSKLLPTLFNQPLAHFLIDIPRYEYGRLQRPGSWP
jgi:hypothetical protein